MQLHLQEAPGTEEVRPQNAPQAWFHVWFPNKRVTVWEDFIVWHTYHRVGSRIVDTTAWEWEVGKQYLQPKDSAGPLVLNLKIQEQLYLFVYVRNQGSLYTMTLNTGPPATTHDTIRPVPHARSWRWGVGLRGSWKTEWKTHLIDSVEGDRLCFGPSRSITFYESKSMGSPSTRVPQCHLRVLDTLMILCSKDVGGSYVRKRTVWSEAIPIWSRWDDCVGGSPPKRFGLCP